MTKITLTNPKGATFAVEVASPIPGSVYASREGLAALEAKVRKSYDAQATKIGRTIGTFFVEVSDSGDWTYVDPFGHEYRVRVVAKYVAQPKARTDRALVAAGSVAEGDEINGRTIKGLGKVWTMSEEQADGPAIHGRTNFGGPVDVQYAYFN